MDKINIQKFKESIEALAFIEDGIHRQQINDAWAILAELEKKGKTTIELNALCRELGRRALQHFNEAQAWRLETGNDEKVKARLRQYETDLKACDAHK